MKEPKVIINLTNKNGTKRSMLSNALKMKKRTSHSLMEKIKIHDFKKCTIKVIYGRDKKGEINNSMIIKDFADIKWALEAFLDKELWL